jgi:hypothetical protein
MRVASFAGVLLLCCCVAVAAALSSGCGSCEQEGCTDGIHVNGSSRLNAERGDLLTVRACVAGDCAEERYDSIGGGMHLSVPVPADRDEAAVRVSVTDRDGRVPMDAQGTARIGVHRPNGEGCSPECRVVRVRIAGDRLVPAT